jgi:hypothetical protein
VTRLLLAAALVALFWGWRAAHRRNARFCRCYPLVDGEPVFVG